MRTRFWPSALRTPGRLARHSRRFRAREAAKGKIIAPLSMGTAVNTLYAVRQVHAQANYGLRRR